MAEETASQEGITRRQLLGGIFGGLVALTIGIPEVAKHTNSEKESSSNEIEKAFSDLCQNKDTDLPTGRLLLAGFATKVENENWPKNTGTIRASLTITKKGSLYFKEFVYTKDMENRQNINAAKSLREDTASVIASVVAQIVNSPRDLEFNNKTQPFIRSRSVVFEADTREVVDKFSVFGGDSMTLVKRSEGGKELPPSYVYEHMASKLFGNEAQKAFEEVKSKYEALSS